MRTRHAACSCGQLHATVEGDPVRISICHCLSCQRRTGSVFAAQARFPIEQVHIHGRATSYERSSDSGRSATFHFCPQCGATVYYQLQGLPEVLAIPIGVFADPDFPPPTVSVYEARRHSWVGLPATIEHID